MNCESLRDFGLNLGIEYAALAAMADEPIVKFMHGRQPDVTFIKAYEKMIWFIDRGDHWIADDAFFQSRSLDDAEVRQLLADWLEPNANHLAYCDPAYLPYCDSNHQG